MGRHQAVAKTYRRTQPVDWGRNVHRRRYMRREMTSVFLIAYALVLLFGLWRLSQGEAAFEAWRASLGHPLALAGPRSDFHCRSVPDHQLVPGDAAYACRTARSNRPASRVRGGPLRLWLSVLVLALVMLGGGK